MQGFWLFQYLDHLSVNTTGTLNVFEAYNGMYNNRFLPGYAAFIIDSHLETFALELITLGKQMNIPIMVTLASRYTKDELLQLSIGSTKEYLTYLAENRAREQLVNSMNKWISDQLEIIEKKEIVAEDITLINYIRSHTLKKFIPSYTSDLEKAIQIVSEIDTIILGSNTTAVDIYIDILKNKIAEQSNLATKVIEASPAVTFIFNTQNHSQLFVSGNVVEVLGYTPEEILHMGDSFLLQLTHPDDLQKLIAHFQHVIAENKNKTQQVEFRFRHKDGMYRWLRTYEVIFKRDATGRPSEILGKTFEVTHEKEIALALEKSEKQLLEAQSIAHIGSYEWNIQENFSQYTAEVSRIFDLTQEQRYEQFLSYVHPEDINKVEAAISKSFETGLYECEYRYIKDGREKVIWSIGRVEFEGKTPVRMLGTVQDITEIKKMERELVRKSEELAHTNESLRQFAYVASHDMKEPLRKIMMFSDLVLNAEKDKLSDKSIGHLQKMQLSGRSLYRMVEDILSFSLLEAKETKQQVQMVDIINEVINLLDETIKEKNATIVYNGLPEIVVVPSQFRQLFQNLLSNSLKFSRKDVAPRIHIDAKITSEPTLEISETAPRYLDIMVQDNGIGFPQDASEKIFELFTRFHSKAQYDGTGLGLSISRRIVDNHGGVIKAFPASEHGAIFKIVLPQPSSS